MTPSLPCKKCGKVDDLETVHPLGIHMDQAILWNCRCEDTRAATISLHTPQELVRKAIVADEMRDWFKRYHGFGKAG
jgi:hypothetical protein